MSREYVLRDSWPAVDLSIDYAAELNPQQREAATAPPGPSLVIAGAGSGKTRTLVYRVAFLLEQGITPDRILLLTFTNKAAKEMMGRVAELVGRQIPELWGGTFHSIGCRILRQRAEAVGFQRDFTILDREDSRDLIKACAKESSLELDGDRLPKPDVVSDIFSKAANKRISATEVVLSEYRDMEEAGAILDALLAAYEKRKRLANGMDFDDLLALWLQLMKQEPSTLEHYQRRFQFVLVDEYQDTNSLQAELIDLLVERHKNLMVVGDDAQSIYSWRGADFNNILKFPERYQGARVFRIEMNYRSTPEILACANEVISHNLRQFEKELVANRPSGPKPAMVGCDTAQQQAQFVAQRMEELRDEGTPLSEIAVLYRSHFHALELQLELTRRGIPFSITSGIRLFEQAHMKDVAAHLKLIANPRDEVSFKRAVGLLPGVGARSADKLWSAFSAAWAARAAADSKAALAPSLAAIAKAAPGKAAAAWAAFCATMSQAEDPAYRSRPDQIIGTILRGGYAEILEKHLDKAKTRLEELRQLQDFAKQFASLEEFLTQVALLASLEAEEEGRGTPVPDSARLSTVHQAKGLEFEAVFVIMLCEGMFPSARSTDEANLEEERRLFYVAVTRAKTHLYLSWPQTRFMHGSSASGQLPSPFLKEISEGLTEYWDLRNRYY
jgi:DNA helicase-2/ATP-dependent DNA helicase PcrA